MKLKRLLILIPLVLLCISLASCGKKTYKTIKDDDVAAEALSLFQYEFDEDKKTVTLKKYVGYDYDVVIPEDTGSYTVTTIGKKCFRTTYITSITISSTITKIEAQAFSRCAYLKEIVIPDSVTEIGDEILYSCSALESVTLSKNITKIPTGMCSKCSALKYIIIPDGVTEIGENAFYWCANFNYMVLPNTVKRIRMNVCTGNTAFNNIYYKGTEEEYNNMFIDLMENDQFLNAKVTYNYTKGEN